jgi:hypothetical protein
MLIKSETIDATMKQKTLELGQHLGIIV